VTGSPHPDQQDHRSTWSPHHTSQSELPAYKQIQPINVSNKSSWRCHLSPQNYSNSYHHKTLDNLWSVCILIHSLDKTRNNTKQ
jgi:hypothetical protein